MKFIIFVLVIAVVVFAGCMSQTQSAAVYNANVVYQSATPQSQTNAVDRCEKFAQVYGKGHEVVFPARNSRKVLVSPIEDNNFQVDSFFTVAGTEHAYVCRVSPKGNVFYFNTM